MSCFGQIKVSGASDRGRVRQRNEDAIHLSPEQGFVLLADGMGGHKCGDVASAMAVSEAAAALRRTAPLGPEAQLAEAMRRANAAIFNRGREDAACRGMGTTLVAALFIERCIYYAHVGDSRLYRFREMALEQLTCDHNLASEIRDGGEPPIAAQTGIARHILSRALGTAETVNADIAHAEARHSDRYLLCSDGLNEMLSDPEIGELLGEAGLELDQAVDRLVAAANDRGGVDNVSVILVAVEGLVAGHMGKEI